jgi:hypothetical protein
LLVIGGSPGVGGCAANWPGWVSSEAGRLPDENDVDASGQLLVDLQQLPHLAVLPIIGIRPGVFLRQAVLVDPLMRRLRVGISFCAPATKITLAAPQA